MPAVADNIKAPGAGGLGTVVTGGPGGCNTGVCEVSGGTRGGNNLFHRFDQFKADGNITGVTVQTGGASAVILGVIDQAGSVLNRPLSLTGGSADLFVLSPGGLTVGSGASFSGVQALNLSTATGLKFGSGGLFDVYDTGEAAAGQLTGAPVRGAAGLVTTANGVLKINGDLELKRSGLTLTVNQDLLLDAQGGNLLLTSSPITAPGRAVAFAGGKVTVDALSPVSVGPSGSWWVQAPAIEILSTGQPPTPGSSSVSNTAIRTALESGGSVTIATSAGPLSVKSQILRGKGTAPSSLQLWSAADLEVNVPFGVAFGTTNISPETFSVDLRHGPSSQVLWGQGNVTLLSKGSLTVGPDTGAGNPGRLVFTTPGSTVAFRAGTVSTGTLSWAPGSTTTLQLADKTQFTVTHNLVQGPGNRIRGSEGTALTIGRQGSIDGGILFADPGAAPLLRVGPGAELTVHNGQFQGFAMDVANGGRLFFSGTQNLANPLRIDNAGQLSDASFAGGAVGATFDTTQAALTLRNGLTGLVQANQQLDLGINSTLENQGRIALANGATLSAGTLTTTATSQIELQGDGSATLALQQAELRNAGLISGAGTVQLNADSIFPTARLVNDGTILPGGDPGIGKLVIAADLELTANSKLAFSLDGLVAGVSYDTLQVKGDVTLGGAVSYGLINGFNPPAGTTFDLITSDRALSGSFASTTDTSISSKVDLVPDTRSTTFLLTAKARPTPPPPPPPTLTSIPSLSPQTENPLLTVPENPSLTVPREDSNWIVIFPGGQTSAGQISFPKLATGANSELSVNLAQAGFGSNFGVLEGGSGPIGFGVVSLDGAQLAMAVTDGDRSRTDDLTRSIEGLSAPPGAPESLSLEVLQKLLQEAEQASRSTAHPFVPAVLSLSFTRKPPELSGSGGDSFLDISLIMPTGDPVGRRVDLSRLALQGELRNLYGQLARQEPLGEQDPASSTRRLHDILIAPVSAELEKNGITSLLIVADRGLQAVPFAALHDGRRWFGERFGFSLTPSLRLTSLAPPGRSRGRLLAVGASQFTSLAPLPLVPEELAGIPKRDGVDLYLNDQFTPKVLLGQAGDPRYDRVHVATHAEFRPGGASQARIYTGNDTLALQDFVRLRKLRGGNPLELVTLSACRTALGDSDSELGFAGLALIAGARSAIGTLWYVDDVATSAYFIQLYRYLDQGLPKADALRATREAMAQGRLRLKGDAILATDGTPLLTGLTPAQQRRVAGGMGHPYFWAGVELLGTPW